MEIAATKELYEHLKRHHGTSAALHMLKDEGYTTPAFCRCNLVIYVLFSEQRL
jgi:hypothetical protein